MVIIADSGSTKCDWVILDAKGTCVDETSSQGLNPYFHSENDVEKAIRSNPTLMSYSRDTTHIFFYGAGSSSPSMCGIIQRGLQRVFTGAQVKVDHDLLGSAMATYDGRPCISCILGTGSNSCFFDGIEVHEEIPSLAYILGDEGSGSYFGKKLLTEYFYKLLPNELSEAFHNEFHLTKEELLQRVYREPNPNTFLAGFMKFISAHSAHSHVQKWLVDGMRHFISIHVKCYANWKDVPVHFVGSIGFIFRQQLEEAAQLEGISLGRIIQKPIDGLAAYHVKYRWPDDLS